MVDYLNHVIEARRPLGRSLVALTAVLILALMILAAMQSSGPAVGASAPHGDSALLRIGDGGSAVYTLAPGEQIVVPVEVVGVTDLGTATVLLSYDPAVVRVVACTGLISTGFDGGACNANYALDAVKFNVISLQGVTGDHRLYNVTFEAVGGDTGATTTALTLTAEHFADPRGDDLNVSTAGGRINIEGTPPVVDVVLRVGDASHHQFDLIPGDSLVVPITVGIAGGRALGAASVLLRYDPQVLRPTHCVRPAAASDGMLGFCNPTYDPLAGLVKFNMMSDSGLSGELHAWDVTFEVASGAAPGAVSDLVLIVEDIADTSGSAMSFQVINGEVLVISGSANSAQVLVGPLAGDGIYTVTQNATTTVSIWVTDVADLGAATLSLSYAPNVVRVLSCTVRMENTGVDAGGCALYEDRIRANLISTGGIDGAVQLVDVVFTSATAASPGATSPLVLMVENFADTTALPLPSRTRDGRIDVTSGGSGTPVALVRVGDGTNGGAFSLPLDGEVDVQVGVQGAVGLAATTVSLHYDPAVVRPVSCTASNEVQNGYCNLWASDGVIRMNAISQAGFNGDVILYTLSFRAVDGAAVSEQSALGLDVTTFDDIYGESLLYELAPGTMTITPAEGNIPQVFLQVGDGPYYLAVGERVTIPVQASVVRSNVLGVVTLIVEYDPAVMQAMGCTLNTAAAANGFDGGGCNLDYGAGQIKLNALSTAGVSGGTSIAWIEFKGIGAVGDTTALGLNVEHLADTEAEQLNHQIETWSLNIAGSDDDGDGAPGTVEMGAPQGGDGNNDGVADALQSNVASVPNIVDGHYFTLVSPAGTSLIDVRATGNPSPGTAPIGNAFPLGFLTFKVQGIAPGSAVTVEVYMPEVAVDTYHKYGPTPDNPTDHWYEFLYDGVTGAEILSDRIVLHFVDGQRGDHDLMVNSEVSDPGGAAETVFIASYELSKVLMEADPFRTDKIINFTISITNTGDAPLTDLGISDHYDNTYITYFTSDPPADDAVDDGEIIWSNLVAGTPGLAPGETFSVEVKFWTKTDTTGLLTPQSPCQEIGQTCNVAIADHVVVAPGNGQAPQSLDVQQAWIDIRIEQPTAVRMAQWYVDYGDGHMTLFWKTAEEINILAFNIYRREDAAEAIKLTEQPIVAEMAGQASGASYSFIDENVRFGVTYGYQLEVIGTNQSRWRMPLGFAAAQEELYLPVMAR